MIQVTKYAQREWSKRKYQGFSDRDYFSAIRSACQGDVSSPFNWDAAFDILLCALSSVSSNHFYIASSSGRLSLASDIAYADDLLSGMASLTGLQLKADIVSAYSLIFSLDIAVSKLRTYAHYPKGPPRLAPGSPFPSIIILTSDWQPHSIPVLYTGTLNVLGKLYDISSPPFILLSLPTARRLLTRRATFSLAFMVLLPTSAWWLAQSLLIE